MKDLNVDKYFEKSIFEVIKKQETVIAWQSLNGVVSKCELLIKSFRKGYSEIELVLKNENDKELANVISGNRVMNLFIASCAISFSTSVKNVSVDQKIKITLPEKYKFHERRTQERVQPTKTSYVSFEYQKGLMKKSIFDVSVGGFSFILSKVEKFQIFKGAKFELMVIELHGRKIKVKAECVNCITVDRFQLENLPYGGQKIAFKFLAIENQDREFIATLVEKTLSDNLPFLFAK